MKSTKNRYPESSACSCDALVGDTSAAEGPAGGPAPRTGWRRLTPARWGWSVSILLHGILLLACIGFSLGRTNPVKPARRTPQAQVLTSMPERPLEPLINNLQVETLPTEPLSPDRLPPAQMPDALPDAAGLPSAAGEIVFEDAGSRLTWNDPAGRPGGGLFGTQFCGTPGEARAVCFVVDCSGSMVIAFDYVRAELGRTVGRLTPAQYFHIIFYAGGEPLEMPPGRLIRASGPNRRQGLAFIDKVQLAGVARAESAAQAVAAALERALTVSAGGLSVDLIYLLTDGQYDQAYVEQSLRTMQSRRDRPARIHVIACGAQQNEPFLRRLAETYQGTYHFVSDEELARMVVPPR
ncbi:MAG: VWA domain-containing protein [Sedimentisphaerales bacterium]|nr:VWA domain-containing protein [Sedimentisphaerales bacterium]